ncbi:MAG: hypothetical protein JXR91_01760 [Deltaproteobacteria bacterium]|nr:hypothetical protein [Deltaproteobacteria bacterium]
MKKFTNISFFKIYFLFYSLFSLMISPAVLFGKTVEVSKSSDDVMVSRIITAELLFEADNKKEAMKLLKQVDINKIKESSTLYYLAQIKLDNEYKVQEVNSICNRIKMLGDISVNLACQSAILLNNNKLDEALEMSEKALDKNANSSTFLAAAKSNDALNNYDKALEYYKKAVENGAKHPAAVSYALLLEKSGESVQALKVIEDAIKKAPESPVALFHGGRISGKGQRGINYLLKALKLKPGWPEASYILGILMIEDNRNREAFNFFTELINKGVTDPLIYIGASRAAASIQNIEKAREFLNESKKYENNTFRFFVSSIKIEIESGNTMEASLMADEVDMNNIDEIVELYDAANIFLKLERYTKADEAARKILKKSKNSSRAFLILGEIFCKRHLVEEGKSYLKKALDGDMTAVLRVDIQRKTNKCR